MPRLYARFIAGHRPLLVQAVLWTIIFLGLLGAGLGVIRWQVDSHIARDQRTELARIEAVHSSAVSAMTMLEQAPGEPCSAKFIAAMRAVAFLPDGLNQFLYAPDGKAHCSADGTRFDPPVELGLADIPAPAPGHASWRMERDLAMLRHPGVVGTIAQLGDFAVAIPPYTGFDTPDAWHSKELIASNARGAAWSLAGERGLHSQVAAEDGGDVGPAVVTAVSCAPQSVFCVASRADLAALARDWRAVLALLVAAAALVAWGLAGSVVSWLTRHWSFAERFKRGLNAQSIVLAYQPIVDLKTNEVVCIEVLARWRDFDKTLVSPARFIPLVAEYKRTRAFTQMVIDRAYEELGTLPARSTPLLVNFNIFACDFESTRLLHWLSRFRHDKNLRAAVELVEEEDIDLSQAQSAIEELAAAGVPTFIDDFGTGYSNIERVAHLPVEGVKLDRSFAMSKPDSIMGRMLVQIIEMIKTSGRVIIVEGVETMARLSLLRSTGSVDLVQGYAISRPLQIDELRAFLGLGSKAWAACPEAA